MNELKKVQDFFAGPNMDRQSRVYWSQKVKPARIAKDLRQEELAEIAGVSRGTVINIENGEKVPQSKNLWAVLQALDLDSDPASQWPPYVEEYIRMIAPLIMKLEESERGEVMGEVIMMLGRATKGDRA